MENPIGGFGKPATVDNGGSDYRRFSQISGETLTCTWAENFRAQLYSIVKVRLDRRKFGLLSAPPVDLLDLMKSTQTGLVCGLCVVSSRQYTARSGR